MKKTRECLHKHGIYLPNWIQLIIWITGICVLLTLTLSFTIRILVNYYDDESNVAIKTQVTLNELLDSTPELEALMPTYLMIEGKTPLTIIADHLIGDIEHECIPCQQLKNVSWDVWTGSNLTGKEREYAKKVVVTSFIDRMLSDLAAGTNPFTDQHHNWTWAQLESCLFYFAWKYLMDRNMQPPEWESTDYFAQIDWAYSNTTWNGSRVIDLLKYHLFEALCRTMELSVYENGINRTKTCEDILLHNSHPVIMTDRHLIFVIPANNTKANIISCTVWRDGEDYDLNIWTPPANWEVGYPLIIHREPLYSQSWKLDNNDDIRHNSRITALRSTRRVYPSVEIAYFVSSKIREERKGKTCNPENNPKKCLLKCSKIWFANYCKCIPFTFRQLLNDTYHDLPYCTGHHYNLTTCNWTKFIDGPQQDCTNDCSNLCHYTAFSFDVSPDLIPISGDKVGFELILRPIIDPFIQFTRTTKDGPEDLLSNIGGIVGFYLGASVFTLCIIIVSCVDLIQSYRRRKTGQNKGDVIHLKAIHLWQMVLMNNTGNRQTDTNEDMELQRTIQKLQAELERIKSHLFKQTTCHPKTVEEIVQKHLEQIKEELMEKLANQSDGTFL